MKKFMAAAILAAFFFFHATAQAQNLTRGPYIQNLRQNSVEILWRVDAPTDSLVEIWEDGASERKTYGSNVPRTAHQKEIPLLKTDTRYYYRVGREAGFLSAPASFQTFEEEDAATAKGFDFVAYGDHRNNPAAHRSVVDAILKVNRERGEPRFVLDSGDYTGLGEMNPDPWDEQYFHPAAEMMSRLCVFPAIGNHEVGSSGPRIPHRYLRNFSPPIDSSGTKYYYSFHYGNAHFFVIDSYASGYEKDGKQWKWLQRELRRSKKPWKIALFHHPPYAHRVAPSVSYGDMDIREHLVPLFRLYGVSAVITGHSHFYQRCVVDDILYVTSGGGGAPLYTPAMPGEGEDFVKAAKKAYHFTRFRIEGDRLTVWAFDTEGKIFDAADYAPKTPELPPPPPLNFQRKTPDSAMKAGDVFIVESCDAEGKTAKPPLYVETGAMANSSVKSAASGLTGKGSRFASASMEAAASFTAQPSLKEAGLYLISVTVPSAGSVNSPNTIFEIKRKNAELLRGRAALTASNAGDKWHDIGLVELSPGDAITFRQAADEPDRFYADAVKFTKYGGD